MQSCQSYRYNCIPTDIKVRSRIRETGGMWPFARQRCCPPGRYWYQSKALHLPDLITLTAGLQRRVPEVNRANFLYFNELGGGERRG